MAKTQMLNCIFETIDTLPFQNHPTETMYHKVDKWSNFLFFLRWSKKGYEKPDIHLNLRSMYFWLLQLQSQ